MERAAVVAWWCGDLLLGGLLVLGWWRKLFSRYPSFYLYVACVVSSEVVRHNLDTRASSTYARLWWISEFVTAAFGFCITWEIFTQMLGPYAGARRMARAILRVLFVGVLLKAGIALQAAPFRALIPTTVELERDLRAIQALLLVSMIALIVHYALPTGRNIRFMLLGYAIYLGSQVMRLSLPTGSGVLIREAVPVLSGLEYCATLAIWCVGMWSFAPNPVPDLALERDYERISGQTIRAFMRLREHLNQSWRA